MCLRMSISLCITQGVGMRWPLRVQVLVSVCLYLCMCFWGKRNCVQWWMLKAEQNFSVDAWVFSFRTTDRGVVVVRVPAEKTSMSLDYLQAILDKRRKRWTRRGGGGEGCLRERNERLCVICSSQEALEFLQFRLRQCKANCQSFQPVCPEHLSLSAEWVHCRYPLFSYWKRRHRYPCGLL